MGLNNLLVVRDGHSLSTFCDNNILFTCFSFYWYVKCSFAWWDELTEKKNQYFLIYCNNVMFVTISLLVLKSKMLGYF